MKKQSVAIALFCLIGFGGISSAIINPPTAIAQTTRTRVQRTSTSQNAMLTHSDPGARITLRSEPNSRSRVRGSGLVGDRVQILNERRSRGRETWYEVQLVNTGERGWIQGENLQTGATGSGSNQMMQLSQAGNGVFRISGRPDLQITQVSVDVDNRNQAQIGFRLSDNRLIRFGGDVNRRDAYTVGINLRNSGNADASGQVDIEYGANNSINQIFGDGRLDGQPFSMTFSSNRTTGNSTDRTQEFLGQNVDHVVRRLNSEGWNMVQSTPATVQLNQGRMGMDIEFNSRTRAVTSVRMKTLN